MPSQTYIFSNFTAGVLSPRLLGRTDMARYANGLKSVQNMRIVPQGGATRRGGSNYIASGKTGTKKVRLINFEFSVTQAYILEFGDQYIRVFKDQGQVTSGGSPVELSTPFLEAELFDLKFTQSADILYIAHPLHEPMTLSRTSHTAWTLATFVLLDGPYNTENTTAVTLTPSGTTGSINITASSATFASTDVNRLIRIKHSSTWGYAKVTGFTSSTVVVATVVVDFAATGAVTEWRLGYYYNTNFPAAVAFYEQRLVWGGSTYDPQLLAFSKSGGYDDHTPGVDDDDAMVYLIATNQVNNILWLDPSQVLAVGTVGGEFIVAASTAGEALTPTNVRVVRQTTYGSHNTGPIRISSVLLFIQRARRKVREFVYKFETDSYVAPDLTILSEHLTSTGLVEMAFQQEPDSTVWCVLEDGTLLGMTYLRDQEVVGWHSHVLGGKSDAAGTQAVVESVAVIPGTGNDGAGVDELWVSVHRYVNGSHVRHIEIITPGLEDTNTQEESFFVDSGLSLNVPKDITAVTAANPAVVTSASHGFSNGDLIDIRDIKGMTELNKRRFTAANVATNTFQLSGENSTSFTAYISGGTAREAATTFTGLSHLEGETVSILGDGAALVDKTVASGAVTLSTAASIVHIGLGYVSKMVTLNIEAGAADGSAQSKIKRIHEVVVRLYRSLGVKIGPEDGDLDIIPFRDSSMPMDHPPDLFTGDKFLPHPEGYTTDGNIEVRQEQPLPLTVLALVARVKTN